MTRDLYDEFEFDVAISFAGEDRRTAEQLANLLAAKHMQVFYDEQENAELPGRDMILHLAEIFRTKARYCVMLISQYYPIKSWTEAERSFAQEHALRDANEYFLPVRLDDTKVPGVAEAAEYRDLRQDSLEGIANLLEQKVSQTKGRSGPPRESHDLRSGNVASKQRKNDE